MAVDWDMLRDRFDKMLEEKADMETTGNEIGTTKNRKPWKCSPGRQDKVYEFIVAYKREHDGNSPTIREIGAAIGVKSSSLITWYLERLEQRGLIRHAGKASRGIEVMGGRWMLAGSEG